MFNFAKDTDSFRKKIKEQKPLIHHITNYVTAGYCADIALAAGASPVMADAVEEMPEMTGKANALVINIGTINANKFEAMLKAAEVARSKHIPIILDPVGAMATEYRLKAALAILAKGVTIIKGNYSEGVALLKNEAKGKGVDNTLATDIKPEELAKKLAQQYKCVVAITGAVDNISDGEETIQAYNGDPMLGNITGSGCMTGTLIGAAAGVTKNYLAAAIYGITMMNIAGQEAAKICKGPGSFRSSLMDEIYQLTDYDLTSGFRGKEL
jgi:hydroxyethylthiazole kinase